MVNGLSFEQVWYLDGEETARTSSIWDQGEKGNYFVILSNEQGLISGSYKLELYVEGQLMQTGRCMIVE